ncbi:MAG: fatty acid desaturase [Pseudomonadales bacterium]|nr:fatty acid desaturase [Pseudomonadales bacterium]
MSTNEDWSDSRFREEFITCPRIAWVSIIFFILGVTVIPSTAYLAANDVIPSWIAVLTNAYCLYMLFMVMHDSAHRSVSQINFINEWTGRISVFLVIPFAALPSWRMAHMSHHRFTNESDGNDPDIWVSQGPKWLLPLRWATLDIAYLGQFFLYDKKLKEMPAKGKIEWAIVWLLTLSLFGISFIFGFTIDLLLYWVLPARMAVFVVALVFNFLPHTHHIKQKEHPFNASMIRHSARWDRLLVLLTMNQSYHTMHHVYPRIPFYLIRKAWFAKLNYHLAQNPSIVSTFGKSLNKMEYLETFKSLPRL